MQPQAMISRQVAFARAKDRLASSWPARTAGNRLEPFADPIVTPGFTLRPTDVVFTIGSCFARNIEEYLRRLGMKVPTLDFVVPAGEREGRPSAILNKYTAPS